MVADFFIELKLHKSSARFEIQSASSHAFRWFRLIFPVTLENNFLIHCTERRLVLYLINRWLGHFIPVKVSINVTPFRQFIS